MIRTYRQHASCSPSSQQDSYIYTIVPVVEGGLAAITSANELLLVDRRNLHNDNAVRFSGVPGGLTTLATIDDARLVVCAGTGGTVTSFDVRTRKEASTFKVGKGVTALASKGFHLAIGTELASQQAIVSLWDVRQNREQWQNAENNDDITAVDFHPSKSNILLCGGDDGLVSLFDTSVSEEDDSLLQAFNHGPIHKAGFVNGSAIYALSSDQNLALHPVYTDERDVEPSPILLGDLRPVIPCEYVIDLFHSGKDMIVAAGSHSLSQVNLVTVKDDGKLDLDNRIVLEGAHGDEIVRSIFSDEQNGMIYTAGEDGQIKAFTPSSMTSSDTTTATAKGSKTKKDSSTRYKPY